MGIIQALKEDIRGQIIEVVTEPAAQIERSMKHAINSGKDLGKPR